MGDRKNIAVDPVTGLITWHEYDAQTDTTTIGYDADSTPVLEQNKRMANDPQFSRDGIKREFWLYASIPVGLQVKWMVEEGLDIYNPQHSDRLTKKLEDPEFKYLKTTHLHHKLKGV